MADALAAPAVARALSIGGDRLGSPPDMRDCAALDDRADVAVYTSDELPKQIASRMAADLHTACDMPSHDSQRTLLALLSGDCRPYAMDARVATLRIAHGAARPSRLLLPVHA